jgi:hypothetical protein
MRLTPRCIELLKLLGCARWLSTRQIHRRFFVNSTIDAARKRLLKLSEGRYVRSHQASRMTEALFTLGPEGRRVLERAGTATVLLERVPPAQIEHFLAVNDIRIAAEQTGDLAYFFAYWELPALDWRWPIIPDAVFCHRGQTVAVEYDRSMESLRYFVRTKMRAYQHGLDGFPIDRVLIVADRPARVAALAEAVGGCSDRVVLATIDQVRRGLPENVVGGSGRKL